MSLANNNFGTANLIFYPSSKIPPISPPFSASWTDTSQADRVGAVFDFHSGTPFVLKNVTSAAHTPSGSGLVLVRQYVTPALPAGNLFGGSVAIPNPSPISSPFIRSQFVTQTGPTLIARIWIAKPDGTLRVDLQGLLVPPVGSGRIVAIGNLTAALITHPVFVTGDTVVPTTPWVAGDFLVIEFGYQAVTVNATQVNLEFGDASTVNNTAAGSAVQNNPVSKFSYFVTKGWSVVEV